MDALRLVVSYMSDSFQRIKSSYISSWSVLFQRNSINLCVLKSTQSNICNFANNDPVFLKKLGICSQIKRTF